MSTEVERLREQLRVERARRAWDRRLFANPALSAQHKLACWAVREELERLPRPDNQYGQRELVQVYRRALGKHYGTADASAGDHLSKLAEWGVVTKRVTRGYDEHGAPESAVYVAATDLLLSHPEAITPPAAKNGWGGKRQRTCRDCGSPNLVARVYCQTCGAVQDEHLVNAVESEPESEPQAASTSPAQDSCPRRQDDPPWRAKGDEGQPEGQDGPLCREEGVQELALLVAIAGDGPRHVRMVNDQPGAPKYVYEEGPVTLELAAAHAQGTVTLGARLKSADGICRALCFDADTLDEAVKMREAARRLLPHGYVPLMEWSPGYEPVSAEEQERARRQGSRIVQGKGRGAHLWMVFDGPVPWEAAYAHVCALSPGLATIKENWPQVGGQMVRLPGGKYHHPDGSTEWCELQDQVEHAPGQGLLRLSHDGVSALAALAAHLTPAAIVPALPPRPPAADGPARSPPSGSCGPACPSSSAAAGPGAVIAAFNARTRVDDLVPRERNGYALAVWRGERTASVWLSPDGTRWVDYGAGGRRSDGSPDGGDAFELLCRLESLRGKSKSQVWREVKEGRHEGTRTERAG